MLKQSKENVLKKFESSDIGKRVAKLSATASPAIAAMIMFPSETYTFLKTARELGFEIPMIIFFGVCIWWFRKDSARIVDTRIAPVTEALVEGARVSAEVSLAVKSLSQEVKENTKESKERARIADERYNEFSQKFVINDQRFLEVSNEIKDVGQKVLTIETRIQGVIPAIPQEELKELVEKVAAENSVPDLTGYP